MTELKAQQTGFAVDTEIKTEMVMELVVQLGAFANSWNPVFEKLHIGIRF